MCGKIQLLSKLLDVFTMDARKLSPLEQKDLRRTALTLRQKGLPLAMIAHLMDVSYAFVQKVVTCAKAFGTESAIAGGTRGRRVESQRLLDAKQEQRIKKMIMSKNPNQLSFDFALWTRQAVSDLIFREYKIRLSLKTVGNYLARWGMTPQRPAKYNFQQKPEAVKKWLENDYPKIEERAKKEGAKIFWQDETKICQDSNVIRGYSEKGRAPVLHENKRAHYSSGTMCAALNNQGSVFFSIKPFKSGEGFDSHDFLQFLKDLVADQKKMAAEKRIDAPKLFVICDNHRMHKTAEVKGWIESHKEEIELFFLPSYSPQLNPSEQFNQCLKNALRSGARRTTEQIIEFVKSWGNELRTAPGKVMNIFLAESVRYASDETLCTTRGYDRKVTPAMFKRLYRQWCGLVKCPQVSGLSFITI